MAAQKLTQYRKYPSMTVAFRSRWAVAFAPWKPSGCTFHLESSRLLKEPRPSTIRRFSERPARNFRIVLSSVSTCGDGQMAVHGWTHVSDTSVDRLIRQLVRISLAAIIYTDIAKDGMWQGPISRLFANGRLFAGSRYCVRRHLPQLDDLRADAITGTTHCRGDCRQGPLRW